MSRGKYSPNLPNCNGDADTFSFNCYGKPAAPWTMELKEAGVEYDVKTMFGDYDNEGFDSYGYSAFNAQGEYVGGGSGVDRNGYTEMDYLCMDADDFDNGNY